MTTDLDDLRGDAAPDAGTYVVIEASGDADAGGGTFCGTVDAAYCLDFDTITDAAALGLTFNGLCGPGTDACAVTKLARARASGRGRRRLGATRCVPRPHSQRDIHGVMLDFQVELDDAGTGGSLHVADLHMDRVVVTVQ